MSERQRMLAGLPYHASDSELVAARLRARELCQQFNQLAPTASDHERQLLLSALFGQPTDVYITAPFFCDYGSHIQLGRQVYFNFNCVILDVAPVTIGDHVLFGPGVQLLTAAHPLDAAERRSGVEFGRPIHIGHDVWLGGGVIVCPGVTIGDGSVIGAGSVVTRDIPPGVVAAGNPCRVQRRLTDGAQPARNVSG